MGASSNIFLHEYREVLVDTLRYKNVAAYPLYLRFICPRKEIFLELVLHPPKKAMLIVRIADIVRPGRGPGFVS